MSSPGIKTITSLTRYLERKTAFLETTLGRMSVFQPRFEKPLYGAFLLLCPAIQGAYLAPLHYQTSALPCLPERATPYLN